VIIDSSAILAVYFQESDAATFAHKIATTSEKFISAPTLVETCIAAVSRNGETAFRSINAQIQSANIHVVPFDAYAAEIAIAAFLKYGKGRGHKAQLNFGDCISYAMSKTEAMPLLFKGDDFIHTDVEKVL
jgi:ribonuclease VapC